MTESVLYHASEGVATITLNRPEVLNALSRDMLESLREAVERAAQDTAVRAAVLTGAGRGFSSGSDLGGGVPAGPVRDLGDSMRERMNPIILALRDMPKPVITAVNGVAAGGGMGIALAGDVVLAGKSASFLQAFSRIGLVPDCGSTYFLPRYVGEMRARALAILAEKIDADEAQRIGMVWKVYPDDALQAEAARMAKHLANMPTMAYGLTKQALNASGGNDLATQLEWEAALQSRAGRTEDFREGVNAFVGKRSPQFKGC
jgi:2-(1,2-epoxy-1,2-dihydrophenyl)acetyl-CoA isomerase